MYGHHLKKSMDQPGKVANSAHGQLNRKHDIFLSSFAPENLVSRDRFGRPVLPQPGHSPHSGRIWCLFTGFLPLSATSFIDLYRQPPSGQPQIYQSRSNCVPMAFAAKDNPQGYSSNECCLFRYYHESIDVRLFSPTPSIGRLEWTHAMQKAS